MSALGYTHTEIFQRQRSFYPQIGWRALHYELADNDIWWMLRGLIELYIIADKYMMHNLRRLCATHLLPNFIRWMQDPKSPLIGYMSPEEFLSKFFDIICNRVGGSYPQDLYNIYRSTVRHFIRTGTNFQHLIHVAPSVPPLLAFISIDLAETFAARDINVHQMRQDTHGLCHRLNRSTQSAYDVRKGIRTESQKLQTLLDGIPACDEHLWLDPNREVVRRCCVVEELTEVVAGLQALQGLHTLETLEWDEHSDDDPEFGSEDDWAVRDVDTVRQGIDDENGDSEEVDDEQPLHDVQAHQEEAEPDEDGEDVDAALNEDADDEADEDVENEDTTSDEEEQETEPHENVEEVADEDERPSKRRRLV